MMGPFFYVSDEGPNRHYPTLSEALEDANESIQICREYCDPEWPMGTDDICIYRCEVETDEPTEDGKLIMRATEVNIREPEEWETGVDYYCDYEMRAPAS